LRIEGLEPSRFNKSTDFHFTACISLCYYKHFWEIWLCYKQKNLLEKSGLSLYPQSSFVRIASVGSLHLSRTAWNKRYINSNSFLCHLFFELTQDYKIRKNWNSIRIPSLRFAYGEGFHQRWLPYICQILATLSKL